jgi:23S rRNA (adenine2503-C2)-methyltransferase
MNKVVPTKAEIALPELLNAMAKNPVAELQKRPATTTLKVELMRIAQIKLRLRDLGAKPCHEDRLLRGWIQTGTYSDSISKVKQDGDGQTMQAVQAARQGERGEANTFSPMKWNWNYDRKGSPAGAFFPLALCKELPAIETELLGLARLHSEHPADKDGVARLLVQLHDGQMVESVLLPRGGLCVSTQVGCAVGCVFCMSGRDGLLRQLGSAEIVAQIVLARKRRAVSKVVFMGMGEPAHNLDNVLEAIQMLGTQGNIGHKNLVFSTVGDPRVFERLHLEKVKPALALSLHTTDAALRVRLLPHAPQIAIEELVERAEAYARTTGYPVQYQWTLLEGINDSDAELDGIARLLSGKYAIMNFIPFNDVTGLAFRRPSAERAAQMVYTLKQQGILAKLRDSAGQEIEGACGQLRARVMTARPLRTAMPPE